MRCLSVGHLRPRALTFHPDGSRLHDTQAQIAQANAPKPGELTIEQQTARTIFETDFVDGREKLDQLKKGRLVMDWAYYSRVVIEPTKKSLAQCRAVKLPDATIISSREPVPVPGEMMCRFTTRNRSCS